MRNIRIVLAIALLVLPATFAYGQCETLTFLTESLPDFFVGQPAHFDIEAIGGTPPYTFEIVEGELPEGLILTRSGQIRGVPREAADTTIFVRLTDAQGCSLTQAFAVRVNP